MAELIAGTTGYPTEIDTATDLQNEVDFVIAEHMNGGHRAIVAIETALGISPQGTAASLADRLAICLNAAGGIHYGTALPSPAPTNQPHLFFNTTNQTLYVRNNITSNYDPVASSTVLANYLRFDTDQTVYGLLTFDNWIFGLPGFAIGANAKDVLIEWLNADMVDGQHRVLNINADHTHASTGAQGGTIAHTALTSIGTNTHAQIDSFISSKGAASGLAPLDASTKIADTYGGSASGIATLNASSKVVQDPASAGSGNGLDADKLDSFHASYTPGNSIIPVEDTNGRLAFGTTPTNRGALAYVSSQSINNTTYTLVAMNNEVYDTDTIHDNSTNNSRLTVPSGVTRVRLTGQVNWQSSGASKSASINKGTSYTYIGCPYASYTGTSMNLSSPVLEVTAGDYFTLEVWQNSGGNLTIDAWLAMEIIL